MKAKDTLVKEVGGKKYRALTTGYRIPQEEKLLNAVTADLDRGNIAWILVPTKDGMEVWRDLEGWMEGGVK